METVTEEVKRPIWWWTRLQCWLYRTFAKKPGNCWRILENEYGWYWYYNKAAGRRGYILSNGVEETEPQEYATKEEFMMMREKFAEQELKELRG